MAESGRVAGSAPADPDPELGRVGLSRGSGVRKPVLWVGQCPPPQSRVARGRPDSESADSAPSRPTLPSMNLFVSLGKCPTVAGSTRYTDMGWYNRTGIMRAVT
ncbi:hypothetical protein Taro_039466 [Colocasia esculenta]|uniref:Uncharacterized protein n=1 Tax=Colocasia esculenta TaxID=4460 RepID=A0A843WGQ2_COLES|nr:hypothetical protein [Colocasia esculenta]